VLLLASEPNQGPISEGWYADGPAPPQPFVPPPDPTSACEAVGAITSRAMARGLRLGHTTVVGTSTWWSSQLNTLQKANERKSLMDIICDGSYSRFQCTSYLRWHIGHSPEACIKKQKVKHIVSQAAWLPNRSAFVKMLV
jgi:hypothetical protein